MLTTAPSIPTFEVFTALVAGVFAQPVFRNVDGARHAPHLIKKQHSQKRQQRRFLAGMNLLI